MEKLTVGLEWFINPDHLPMMIGLEKGWFQDAGLKIEMVEPEEHFDAIDEMKAGKMDIAITEPLHLVEDRAAGEDVVGFARFLHTNGGVMYIKGKEINRPKDLIGKRIQYPGAPGLGGLAIVKTMVESDGGSCSIEDFIPVNNGFYHTEALEKDLADAATLIFKNFEVTEAKLKGLNVDYFALKDWGIPDFCQLIFITSSEILNSKKETLKKFVKIIRKAIDFIYENEEEAKRIYFDYTKTESNDELAIETANATIPCFTYDFSMSSDYYGQLQNWLKKTGKINEAIDPAKYWTNKLNL
ncbi:ABC transporter substrate-binding protein [Pueribacillus theae]|uniref:Thiamine pyrimidine synthase n=1 Tax=Pueribacillus theae TaxID=2171751 RepID=A0A2U1JUA7_9BACI|nr:ABC transporter substrate-binding protein [Pueribacillus theae]PWA08433.1 ABC transporter substrate-binding protein [Pueribacillus theae]